MKKGNKGYNHHMNKNKIHTFTEWTYSNRENIQYSTWKNILPLKWKIKQRISKLNLSLDYDWRLREDEKWLANEDETIPMRRKKKRKFSDTYTQELIFEEMITTILTDSNLSQSYENPEWYPPVPEYTPPEWREFTAQEIRNIQNTKKGANASNFVRDNITITRAPMTVNEFEKRCDSLIQLNAGILGSTIIHERDIDVITGYIRTPLCTHPDITTQVGYLVSTLINPSKSVELTGIYIYQNSTILSELLEFLANLDVSNPDDLIEAQITLRELYWSITSKP